MSSFVWFRNIVVIVIIHFIMVIMHLTCILCSFLVDVIIVLKIDVSLGLFLFIVSFCLFF